MKKYIFIVLAISNLSIYGIDTKELQEILEIGQSMDKMNPQTCIPIMKEKQKRTKEIQKIAMRYQSNNQELNDIYYKLSIDLHYCIKCLRVKAKKHCSDAKASLNKILKIKQNS